MTALDILVAEDNPVNRALIRKMLERLGHKVTLAEDGESAVAQWQAGRFDAILMDVQMPRLDGLEATRRIRAAEAAGQRPPVTIYALTADALPGDRELCLGAGMDGYLPKPLPMDQLRQTLAALATAA